jgi:hypothetical protein
LKTYVRVSNLFAKKWMVVKAVYEINVRRLFLLFPPYYRFSADINSFWCR